LYSLGQGLGARLRFLSSTGRDLHLGAATGAAEALLGRDTGYATFACSHAPCLCNAPACVGRAGGGERDPRSARGILVQAVGVFAAEPVNGSESAITGGGPERVQRRWIEEWLQSLSLPPAATNWALGSSLLSSASFSPDQNNSRRLRLRGFPAVRWSAHSDAFPFARRGAGRSECCGGIRGDLQRGFGWPCYPAHSR